MKSVNLYNIQRKYKLNIFSFKFADKFIFLAVFGIENASNNRTRRNYDVVPKAAGGLKEMFKNMSIFRGVWKGGDMQRYMEVCSIFSIKLDELTENLCRSSITFVVWDSTRFLDRDLPFAWTTFRFLDHQHFSKYLSFKLRTVDDLKFSTR